MNITIMDDAACTSLIQGERIGRLGCCKDGRAYVVPIHYVSAGSMIYSFTMPGQKLDFMRGNPNVCLQIDKIERSEEWKCVLVEGVFRESTMEADQQEVWKLLEQHNDWWEIGSQLVKHGENEALRKPVYFSISMDVVTGRQALTQPS
jgi:nitroimidazol reductase NimA-like FMN-containing flavoprotein (pyridoxamine 5'-phosphate oxidase superfamily)